MLCSATVRDFATIFSEIIEFISTKKGVLPHIHPFRARKSFFYVVFHHFCMHGFGLSFESVSFIQLSQLFSRWSRKTDARIELLIDSDKTNQTE